MSTFTSYLYLGYDHIADWAGYDHMLFLLGLTAVYTLQHLRQLLILVTAFTVGHSLTLILATLDLVAVSSAWVEFLIPTTIFLTALYNLFFNLQPSNRRNFAGVYLMALLFGLIHGLGFSNYLRELLGREANLVTPLLGFNIGLELGQLLIVAVIVVINYLLIAVADVRQRDWNLVVSGGVLGLSLVMLLERMPL